MRGCRWLIVFLACSLGIAGTANAISVTYDFSGSIDVLSDPTGSVGPSFTLGDTYTGVLTLDLDGLDVSPDLSVGVFNGAATLAFTFSNGITSAVVPADVYLTGSSLLVQTGSNPLNLSGVSPSNNFHSMLGILFTAQLPQIADPNEIPAEISLEDWDSVIAGFGAGGASIYGQVDLLSMRVDDAGPGDGGGGQGGGPIDQEEEEEGPAIPEPAAVVLFAAGLGIVGRRRWQARQAG